MKRRGYMGNGRAGGNVRRREVMGGRGSVGGVLSMQGGRCEEGGRGSGGGVRRVRGRVSGRGTGHAGGGVRREGEGHGGG